MGSSSESRDSDSVGSDLAPFFRRKYRQVLVVSCWEIITKCSRAQGIHNVIHLAVISINIVFLSTGSARHAMVSRRQLE